MFWATVMLFYVAFMLITLLANVTDYNFFSSQWSSYRKEKYWDKKPQLFLWSQADKHLLWKTIKTQEGLSVYLTEGKHEKAFFMFHF